MAAMTRSFPALLVLSLTAVAGGRPRRPALAQDGPLAVARDLYASARYDEALAMLNGVRQQESGNPINLRSIEQYRSLCLLALGRGAEAEAAIAVVVASDPMYQPTETEASPRVRTAFSEVRQRQLPDIARTRYASAKAAFDRKDYPAAEQQFRELLRLIDDPDMGGRLGDLRMLVTALSTSARPRPRRRPSPSRSRSRAAKRRRRPRRAGRARSAESLLLGRRGRRARRRRSGRKCRACRCRSPIRPASAASST